MKPSSLFPALVATLALGATSTRAAILANYNFDSATPQASAPTEPGSIAENFLYGPGINGGSFRFTSFTSATPPNSINMLGSETNGNNVVSTVEAEDYWSFTVTTTVGTLLNLDSLTFRYGGSTDITSNIFVRSSADGFTNNLAFSTSDTVLTYTVPGGTTGSFAPDPTSIPLPGHQNLSAITFRIYGYDTTSSANTSGVRLDDVILNGTVIPEPSTLLTLTTASLLLLPCRRRSDIPV